MTASATRPLRWIMPGVLLLGLVACGPPRKSVFPPTVTIQQMKVESNGTWQLAVRIQNNSYGEMDFRSLDGELKLAALVPVRLHGAFKLDIPALAGDVVTLDVLPTPAMAEALRAVATKGSAGSIAYTLTGTTQARPEQEKQPRDFEFHGKDWLSPVPGIARTWR
jgi:hypothetical protein